MNNGNFVFQNEALADKQRIRDLKIIRKDSASGKDYAHVQYFDDELKIIRDGWIEASFIVPDSLSAIQIIAIIVLTLLTLCSAVFVIIRVRRKKQV